jgi:hypothetical protein
MQEFVIAYVVGLLVLGLVCYIRAEFRHRKGGDK